MKQIRQRYEQFHPNLIVTNNNNDNNNNIFEVYAFYNNTNIINNNNNNNQNDNRIPDTGTVLRFLDATSTKSDEQVTIHSILGLQPIVASFLDDSSQAAYCDHWVSNVFDRTEFLDTLYDTLGFTSKVDFNAGVVAAGEAQIESTVTGNTPTPSTSIVTNTNIDSTTIESQLLILQSSESIYQRTLRDQNQVYLPINNALSKVGHVHGFLQELGQGIQHIASRVTDLVAFVQRCNDYRTITNEGMLKWQNIMHIFVFVFCCAWYFRLNFLLLYHVKILKIVTGFSFLRIPRSYYGVLTVQQLTTDDVTNGVSVDCAEAILSILRRSLYLTTDNAVILDVTRNDIDTTLSTGFNDSNLQVEFEQNKQFVLDTIIKSRYYNVYSLLKDSISEKQYMGIVRNQILVDIQGNDLLYQIFTSNILQRNPGDEAPFLEFIQRVCSVNKNNDGNSSIGGAIIKPGCGGFGTCCCVCICCYCYICIPLSDMCHHHIDCAFFWNYRNT
jgi:hypothetical protein